MKNDCPCNGCTAETGRNQFCHGKGKCERWEKWKENREEEKEKIYKYKEQNRPFWTDATTRKHFRTLKSLDWLRGGPKN